VAVTRVFVRPSTRPLRWDWIDTDDDHPILGDIDPIRMRAFEMKHFHAESRFADVEGFVHVQAALGSPNPVDETASYPTLIASRICPQRGRWQGIALQCLGATLRPGRLLRPRDLVVDSTRLTPTSGSRRATVIRRERPSRCLMPCPLAR
jgi:hypothetical protein